jgi:type II secretory pathway component GspD/PulD (secretin)
MLKNSFRAPASSWPRRRFPLCLCGALALAALPLAALTGPAGAQAPARKTQVPSANGPAAALPGTAQSQTRLYIVRQSLVSAFETLGTLGNVAVQVDPAIDRIVSDVNLQGTTPEVFAQLARQHGLFYWFDGARFVIAPGNSLGRWVVSTSNLDDASVLQMVSTVAPVLPPEAARFDPNSKLLHVSGPRELKDALELAIDSAGRDRPGGISVIRYGIPVR